MVLFFFFFFITRVGFLAPQATKRESWGGDTVLPLQGGGGGSTEQVLAMLNGRGRGGGAQQVMHPRFSHFIAGP